MAQTPSVTGVSSPFFSLAELKVFQKTLNESEKVEAIRTKFGHFLKVGNLIIWQEIEFADNFAYISLTLVNLCGVLVEMFEFSCNVVHKSEDEAAQVAAQISDVWMPY